MNKTNQVNYRKLFWLGVLILVIGYGFGEPYLEKLIGIDLPSIRETNNSAVDENSDTENHNATEGRSSVDARMSSRQESATLEKPESIPKTENGTSSASKPYLTPTGKKNRLRSPAGLVYGESRGEHRVDHVMRHAVDDKNRPIHSVFNGSKEEILKVIDEAYELIKAKSKRVSTNKDKRLDFRVQYTVDMKRKIGYLGGQKGRRENYPPRSKLTLVLDNEKFVVTAYPDN